jgi:ComF family protein
METLGGWAFAGLRSSGQFIGPLAHAVRRLKYGKMELLGAPLGEWLALRCVDDGLLPHPWQTELAGGMVVPVPLHPSRLRERGFNQAELLAVPLADALRVEMSNALTLRRVRRTDSQVGQSAAARRTNITEDVFGVGQIQAVQNRPILLVDDVFTTGTTLNACARALSRSGANPVYAVTLAAGI